jgi:hypothetical protein
MPERAWKARQRMGSRYQSVVLTVILLWMVFSWSAEFAYNNVGIGAVVDQSCTVRGDGDATCTFTNMGWSPGSQCVRVGVQRTSDQARLGSALACSGNLATNDSSVVTVSVLEGSTAPVAFCAGALGQAWTEVCTVFVERAVR